MRSCVEKGDVLGWTPYISKILISGKVAIRVLSLRFIMPLLGCHVFWGCLDGYEDRKSVVPI